MFVDLVELGKVVAYEKNNLKVFMEDIGNVYTTGVAINFTENGEKFLGCHTETFNNEEKRRTVLYKRGPRNGWDPLPVSHFSGEVDKVYNRMKRYVSDLSKHIENKMCINLQKSWHESKREIQKELSEKINNIKTSPQKGVFLYIRIAEKPFWEYRETLDYFKVWISKIFAEKYGVATISENTLCSLCNVRKAKVYGNVSTVSSYHLDQPGAIAGGCRYSHGARNFPVCFECAGYLSKGFDYSKRKLDFSMGGLRYLLIPSSSQHIILKNFIDIIERKKSEVTLNKEELGSFVGTEERLLKKIAYQYGDQDFLTLKMVFYIREQNKWRILGEIQKILPSRLKRIYEAKKECESLPFLKKVGEPDYVSLRLIRSIAGEDSSGNNKFLSYVSAVFEGNKIFYNIVLHDVIKRLRKEYKINSRIKEWLARHSLLLLYFLDKIDVITLPEGGIMDQNKFYLNEYLIFMNEHRSFFGTSGKRVAFLTGALIGEVLYSGPDSQPFRKHLGDYRFDRRKLMKLRALAEAKISAYDRDKGTLGKTRELRQLLDICWSETEDRWPETEDELTLATIMGINLNGYIVRKIVSKNKGGNDGSH